MPVYAFDCAGCGSFELVWLMTGLVLPGTCPVCGAGGRGGSTPPALALLARPMRRALDMEEKSAHEPEVVREKRGSPRPHRHDPTPPWVLSH